MGGRNNSDSSPIQILMLPNKFQICYLFRALLEIVLWSKWGRDDYL